MNDETSKPDFNINWSSIGDAVVAGATTTGAVAAVGALAGVGLAAMIGTANLLFEIF